MEAGLCAGEVSAGLSDSILPSECWVHIFSFLRGSELARYFSSPPPSPSLLLKERKRT